MASAPPTGITEPLESAYSMIRRPLRDFWRWRRSDRRAAVLEAATARLKRSYAAMWDAYTLSPAWRGLKPRTQADYQRVRDWIGDRANSMIPDILEARHVAQIRDEAHNAKGQRFSNYVIQVMRLTIEWGRGHDWCKTNAFMGAKLSKRAKGKAHANRAWSPEEIMAFGSAAPAQLIVPFALGLFAGLRQGDALTVKWDGYDGATLRWTAGKNDEACAAPVTGEFKAVLDAALAAKGAADEIATNSAGDAWTPSGFRASFFGLIRKLVAAKKLRPGCTFHGLRHTIATIARDGGSSESQVAASIGDRSLAMAALYGRNSDRAAAQTSVLTTIQDRFSGGDWQKSGKTEKPPVSADLAPAQPAE
jgi:integrase